MATTWKAPTWRMPNDKNQSKFESYSLEFSGTNNYITIDSSTDLDNAPLTPYSFSFWFKQPSHTGSKVLSEKRAANTFLNAQYTIHSENGFIAWYGGAGAGVATYTSSALSFNEWHHIVCVAESTTVSKIYVDGQLNVTSSNNRISSSTLTNPTFRIGSNYTGAYRFVGQISRFCIFDYALSEPQVRQLYNSKLPINPMTLKPAPIASYLLGGNASTGGDSSKTLSVPNVAVPDASVFEFDNTVNQYIWLNENQVESNSSGLEPQVLSSSCWVKFNSLHHNDYIWSRINSSNYGIGLYISDGKLRFQVGDFGTSNVGNQNGNWSYFNSAIPLSDLTIGEWTHICCTWNGTSTKIFINGICKKIATPPSTLTIDYNSTYVYNGFKIGARNQPTSASYVLDGEMSNFQFWNTALTDGSPSEDDPATGEVAELYNNGQPLMTGTQPQEANLQAWYKLDQSANWEADTASNWQIPDNRSVYPQSFNFRRISSASNGRVNINNNLSFPNKISVSIWFNYPTDTSTNTQYIIAQDNGSSDRRWVLGFNTSNKVFANVYNTDNSSNYFIGITTVKDSKWHQVVLVYDGTSNTNGIKMFLDGKLEAQATASGTGLHTGSALMTAIGNGSTSTQYGALFDCNLSNAQIWDTDLTYGTVTSVGDVAGGEVSTLYNNGVPLTTAIASDNLKAWYKLDNTELFDGTNWSVNNQKYPASYESAIEATELTGLELDSATPNLGTTQSFSWWVNYKKPSLGSYLWNKGFNGWRIYVYNNGRLLFRPVGNNAYMVDTGTGVIQAHQSIGNGKWYHYVLTRDGENVVIYQNSVPVYTGTIPGTDPAPATDDINFIASEYGGYDVDTKFSNFCIFNNKLEQSDITSLYNNGTPLLNMDSFSSLQNWWKLNNLTTGLQASAGNINASVRSGTPGFNEVNTFVSTEAGLSSGMTEQNLVFNNVSSLNGESSGMNTSNLVTSTLTRKIPYNSYSLNFDAASSDSISFNFTNTSNIGSISVWVNPTNYTTGQQVVWCFNGSGHRDYIGLFQLSSGVIGFETADNGVNKWRVVTTSSAVTNGVWTHLLCTFDGSNAIIYVDGVAVPQSYTHTSDITYWWNDLTPTNYRLGVLQVSGYGTGQFYDGKFSNVSIFNEALTSTEVLKLYNSSVPSNLSNFNPTPVSWWSLGSDSYFNGANYICPDLIGTNNGTSSGMDANALVGNAPNSTANGTSTNMTYDANLTGSAPNSSNNSFSVNMSFDDRETDVPS